MSRALLRSVLELRAAAQTTPRRLAPAFVTSSSPSSSPILSSQPPSSCSRRGFNSTTPIVEPVNQPHVNNAPNPTENQVRPLAFKKSHPSPPPAAPVTGDSVRALLPLLAAQPGGHYITVHIHGFPYLVQEGDQVRLPFRMPGVLPGDVLRLNRASVLGSRDYTLKGAPHVDESLFECRATVLGVESEPLRIKVKTKRRQRRKKQAKSKHRYTILRISELTIKTAEEVDEPSV
ncbi:aconitate hydratase [Purpureocillium lilacinum]|uniref:Large ribosomal subunit protein bL21m n=1 Tax=Purpureocillium lilacinum TaxID=33203 RepID=A0A179GWN9_PURLI|nr:aconitate hydratase [Purpureocillium lilacinum]